MAFLLVDCNSFYVSCEMVFKPQLKNFPAIVLSNNDGCVVARNQKAKEVGIPMGAPYFKYTDLIKNSKTVVFSSNYALYGDMSSRVMQVFRDFGLPLEIYSIDEAFIQAPDCSFEKLKNLGELIRENVLQRTGIEVSVGIGPTKTLAKVANELAKMQFKQSVEILQKTVLNREQREQILNRLGVLNLRIEYLEHYLKKLPVEEVWGVGRKYSKMLQKLGVVTAWDFVQLDPGLVKSKMTTIGAKTLLELQGIPCFPLVEGQNERKSVASTRSFGQAITNLNQIQESVSYHASEIGKKLRQENLNASFISVFLITNRFKQGFYHNHKTIVLATKTNHTPHLITAAKKCLHEIFKPGLAYKKTGVYVSGLVHSSKLSPNLWGFAETGNQKQNQAMLVMDKINTKYGSGTLKLLASGTKKKKAWEMNSSQKSPRYTTCWEELLVVKI